MKLEFSREILEKHSNTTFHENPSSESRFILYRQTDGHDEANSRSSQSWEGASKEQEELLRRPEYIYFNSYLQNDLVMIWYDIFVNCKWVDTRWQ